MEVLIRITFESSVLSPTILEAMFQRQEEEEIVENPEEVPIYDKHCLQMSQNLAEQLHEGARVSIIRQFDKK